MTTFRVGVIGCGKPWGVPGATGMGQGYIHALGYIASPDCELVAAADIQKDNLDAFTQRYGVPHGYLDYREMLDKEKLDMVSVCLWPHLHAPVTLAAAEAGVKAVHCEKPMAPTWGEALKMVQVCAEKGVQLTFNHQRRFGKSFYTAQKLLDEGKIGQLERLEGFTANLYDWGTHWFDMMFFFNDEQPVEWVLGQIDARGSHKVFDVLIEGQGLSTFKWKNGVYGLMSTGGDQRFDCAIRLVGSEGVIELWVRDGPALRMRNVETKGQWKEFDVGVNDAYIKTTVDAVLDSVNALREGREPMLSARKALQATEVIFATYESCRRRGRVDLPLQITDSPLQAMHQSGQISVVDEKPVQDVSTLAGSSWVQGDVFANRLKIHYYRTGGDKPPFVLLHGFSDNGLCWIRAAKALEADYDLLMPDARGHGLTSAPESGYDDPMRAADVAEFVKMLALKKPALMGHSMGAASTAMAAANYPDLWSCIVLEDPPWFGANSPWAARWQSSSESEAQLRMLEHRIQIEKQRDTAIEEIIAKGREGSPAWEEIEWQVWGESKKQLSPNAAVRMGGPRPDWRELVRRIAVPTLLIVGDPELHAIVTLEVAQEAAALNPLIEVVQLKAGHNIRREQFEAFIAAVQAFLKKHYKI
ncbi:MAG: alpha/beta fold hydrolase [Anaerolineae bacterium]|nr:alpha/beta fold hydrolase [Anaerolineae bacterium]